MVGWGLLEDALKPAWMLGFTFSNFSLYPLLYPLFGLNALPSPITQQARKPSIEAGLVTLSSHAQGGEARGGLSPGALYHLAKCTPKDALHSQAILPVAPTQHLQRQGKNIFHDQ